MFKERIEEFEGSGKGLGIVDFRAWVQHRGSYPTPLLGYLVLWLASV